MYFKIQYALVAFHSLQFVTMRFLLRPVRARTRDRDTLELWICMTSKPNKRKHFAMHSISFSFHFSFGCFSMHRQATCFTAKPRSPKNFRMQNAAQNEQRKKKHWKNWMNEKAETTKKKKWKNMRALSTPSRIGQIPLQIVRFFFFNLVWIAKANFLMQH